MVTVNPNIEQQFLEAYNAYAEAIFKHCYYRLFNRDRAKELMQETFLRAWEQVTQGVPIRNLRALLYKIALNLVIDETRKKKMTSLDSLQEQGFDPGHSPEGKLINKLDADHLKTLVAQLEPDYQTVIMMRYIDELAVTEIAEILGITANVASVRLHRGLAQLKKILTNV